MTQPEKRILIIEVSGECRNLRITDEGTYCAAYIHGGWERIDPNKCASCDRPKNLAGVTKKDVIAAVSKALMEKAKEMDEKWENSDPNDDPVVAEDLAEAALQAVLKKAT